MLRRLVSRTREFMFPLTSGLAPIRMDELLGGVSEAGVQLADWDKDLGAGSMWDLLAVCLLAAVRRPLVCFEIGTGHGRTTLHLALNAPEPQVHTLDISTADHTGSLFRGHPVAVRIQRHTGDSAQFSFAEWKGRVDLVFVDGDHKYEGASRDSAVAFELLAPGGCIVWDDFAPGWPGVVRALKPYCDRARRLVGTKLAVYVPQITDRKGG